MADTSGATPSHENWQRGFWSLILTQFQGAFSDNALKYLVLFLVIGAGMSQAQQESITSRVGVLFSLPFILFSMYGGFLADRFSKRRVTIQTKFLEIGVMMVAILGLAAHSLPLQLAAIFLISTQAALFGPSKYGLLPELLPEKKLSWGNGVLELGTFVAIIFGTAAGIGLASQFRESPLTAGLILTAVSGIGLLTSFGITRVMPAAPQRSFEFNFVAQLAREMRDVSKDQTLYLAVIGNAYFFFIAALLQMNIPVFGETTLHAGAFRTGMLFAATALGIGFGSLAAGYLSGHKIEYGLIPLGSVGMTLLGGAIYFVGASYRPALVLLAVLGFFSGFFIVPISAMIQHRPT
jgi:acyl-[acyl-carrier-protein]-phospholipid O-acyltransferase/long-chain-fatty-acid--[acyl-carrier-protein] ligase